MRNDIVCNYPIITLCGSTRFKNEFMEVQKRLTLEGNIVISVGLFGNFGDSEVWENMDEGILIKTKEMHDDMHKRKIDMADEIHEGSSKSGSTNHSGGCLTSFLLIMTVPIGIVLGVISILV